MTNPRAEARALCDFPSANILVSHATWLTFLYPAFQDIMRGFIAYPVTCVASPGTLPLPHPAKFLISYLSHFKWVFNSVS